MEYFIPIIAGIEVLVIGALIGGAVAAAAAFLLQPDFSTGVESRKGSDTNVRSAEEPQHVVYGFTVKGGTLVYINGTGQDNTYLHEMLVVASHECEAIGKIFFNSEEVDEDFVLELPPPPETVGIFGAISRALYLENIERLRSEASRDKGVAYADRSRLKRHLGNANQLADADAVSENPNWTDDHRMRGHAHIYARLEYDPDVFTSFIPNITAEVFGRKIYDPRDGQMRWTMNPALIVADILETILLVPRSSIDQDALIVAANICDQLVDRKDGEQEPRYTANGYLILDGNWEDYLTAFINAMAGAIVEVGGTYYIHAGAWTEPVLTITDNDFMGPVSRKINDTDQNRANSVKGKYVSPSSFDKPTEFPPVKDAVAIGEDGGQVNWLEVDLDKVNSHTQAQRVASIALNETRLDEVIVFEVPLVIGLDLRPWDNVILQSDIFGIEETYRVIDHRVAPGGGRNSVVTVELTLKRHDEAVYDWNPQVQEKDIQNATTNLPGQGSKNPSGATYALNPIFTDPSHRIAEIDLSWTDPADTFEAIEIEITMEVECRVQDDGTAVDPDPPVPGPWQTVTVTETREVPPAVQSITFDVLDEALTGGPYDFQNHVVTQARIRSRIDSMTWGPWLTPDVA